ncbi:MAG: DUF5615 family PIN-like protein [Acidobacteriota bacterium]
MRVLFDQGTPAPLRKFLAQHEVSTAYEKAWSKLRNGELLDVAEREGYAVLVTTDSNLKHQQDLKARRFGTVVLLSTSWPRIQRVIGSVVEAINATVPGSYTEVEIPYSDG